MRPDAISVGGATVAAIWGNKVAAGLFDRYLARFGYDAQQTDQSADPNRRDNLVTHRNSKHV